MSAIKDVHLRCQVCNYCRATDGPRDRVEVNIFVETRQTLCTECAKAILGFPDPSPPPSEPSPHAAYMAEIGPFLNQDVASTEDALYPIPPEEDDT